MRILAEARSTDPIRSAEGHTLYRAAVLPPDSDKYRAIDAILRDPAIAWVLSLHERLDRALGCDDPLVIVTDWSDPCEVVGLRLEDGGAARDYPTLCFLALYTNWDDLPASGIEAIFAHELSHLWLHRMGYQPALSQSNRFHTSTAITDPVLAFSEGFAEHLEILSAELDNTPTDERFYDTGYDLRAWLCDRDSALRVHAVKNNRFLYLTATPEPEDFASYRQLHMAHITSSAFLPERLKNGLQAISSEGLIATFFYCMTRSAGLRETPAPEAVCRAFGGCPPEQRLYLKLLWAMTKLDWSHERLFTDFVAAYLDEFPQDRDEVLRIFAEVTSFVTVDARAQSIFGTLYRVGRQGDPAPLVQLYKKAEAQKAQWLAAMADGTLRLDAAVYPSLWVETDKDVLPVPWDTEHPGKLKIDLNAATDVDLFALNGLRFAQCQALVALREQRGGFASVEAFWQAAEALEQTQE